LELPTRAISDFLGALSSNLISSRCIKEGSPPRTHPEPIRLTKSVRCDGLARRKNSYDERKETPGVPTLESPLFGPGKNILEAEGTESALVPTNFRVLERDSEAPEILLLVQIRSAVSQQSRRS
jgi:hypothetical protein